MAASNAASVSPATAPRLSVLLRGGRNVATLQWRWGGGEVVPGHVEEGDGAGVAVGGARAEALGARPAEAVAPPVDVVERQTTRFEDLLWVSREERRRAHHA
ncbi:unnamed protein product [Urochloa humidicola]